MARQECDYYTNLLDYSKKVYPWATQAEITTAGITYTATSNGLFYPVARIGAGSTISVSINDVTITQFFTADMTSASSASGSPIISLSAVLLEKGQTVKLRRVYGSYSWNNGSIFISFYDN